MNLTVISQRRRFNELDQITQAMGSTMLNKLQEGAQQLNTLPKTINDVITKQNSQTQAVIIDAVRRIVEQKEGRGGNVTSIGLVEVSSTSVADSVLGHL